jgi:hypothetical protein
MATQEPQYPITVLFNDDGEKWILDNEQELGNNLEWFNSNDPEENAEVTDALGRNVEIFVEKLEVKKCILAS